MRALMHGTLRFLSLALAGLSLAPAAWAYPEMVRKGYGHCSTCHVSPTGGGILTDYGRALSKEALSTWGREGESDFAYGLVKLPEWLKVGGDVRAVQTYVDTARYREGRLIWMQGDLETAVALRSLTFVGTVGADGIDKKPFSRRHYALWRLPQEPDSEIEWFVRGGKFVSAYGLGIADHIAATRRGLGFDQGSETYNLELSRYSPNWGWQLTANLGRPDRPSLNRERGGLLNVYRVVGETHRVGVQGAYLTGTGSTDPDRTLAGMNAALGFRSNLFLLADWSAIRTVPISGSSTWGLAHYHRLDYEVLQGLHVYLFEDLLHTNLNRSSTLSQGFGLGTQFFPRPHLEVQVTYQLRRQLVVQSGYMDFAAFLFHVYL